MNNAKRKTLKFKGEDLFINVLSYRNNNRIAILAYKGGEPYSDITINLSGMCVDENEGFIDSLAESIGLEQELVNAKIIKEVYGKVKYNMGTYDAVAFDLEELKKYDPEGVEKFNLMLKEKECNYEM